MTNYYNKQHVTTKIGTILRSKYLGLITDCHSRWGNHTQHIRHKVRRSMNIFINLERYSKYPIN